MASRIAPGLFSRESWCRPRRERRGRCCCIHVKIPPDRPDPATYSQDELLAAGQVPTWNSPDITTNDLSPWKLLAETKVVVRNLSATASAVNTSVTLFTSAFGIGMQRAPLSTQVLNLAPGQEVKLDFPLTQALLGGDQYIGAYVLIQHPNDKRPINNRGSQLIYGVHTKESGRNPTLKFPVLNSYGASRPITLTVLPNALGASVTPASHTFAPWEQIQASLTLHVPAGMHNTTEEVTVVGWAPDGSAIDGVTYIVMVND